MSTCLCNNQALTSKTPRRALYLGPEGTFSYFAGRHYLGTEAVLEPCHDLEDVFRGVAGGQAQAGIVPLENSMQGTVVQSLDCFLDYPVTIQGEVFCKITHSLLTHSALGPENIQRVYSHPQALAQCSRWLKTHLPQADIAPVESTAAAAQRVVEQSAQAAIGHAALAHRYGLQIIAHDIGDLAENYTRFLVIGSEAQSAPQPDKSSLLFTVPDTPGSLAAVLNLLASASVNLNKLESRPLKQTLWAYFFFVDVACNLSHPTYRPLLQKLTETCRQFRVLGCYASGRVLKLNQ